MAILLLLTSITNSCLLHYCPLIFRDELVGLRLQNKTAHTEYTEDSVTLVLDWKVASSYCESAKILLVPSSESKNSSNVWKHLGAKCYQGNKHTLIFRVLDLTDSKLVQSIPDDL